MKMFGVTGWSGSGKTTLITALLPHLTARGLRVAVIKHTHHHPGFGAAEDVVLAQAGGVEHMMVSPRRFALVHASPHSDGTALTDLLSCLRGIDLVLVEGFKHSPHPRLEVWDVLVGEAVLALSETNIKAVAADTLPPEDADSLSQRGVRCFRRDDVTAIADFLLLNSIETGQWIFP